MKQYLELLKVNPQILKPKIKLDNTKNEYQQSNKKQLF